MGSIVENTPDGSKTDKNLDRTQWGVIRDHKEKVYYFFTQFNSSLFSVDLKTIDFDTDKTTSTSVIQSVWHTDITSSLMPERS
jgi:choloylglycine hydrolase